LEKGRIPILKQAQAAEEFLLVAQCRQVVFIFAEDILGAEFYGLDVARNGDWLDLILGV